MSVIKTKWLDNIDTDSMGHDADNGNLGPTTKTDEIS
jgi:hypothetical protein